MPELEVLDEKQRLKSLKEMLHRYSAPAAEQLMERKPDGAIQCFACGHRCLVKPGRDGVCRVRFNEDGTLLVPHGYVGALACDPIEKKPFFHVLPGSDALTFGMLGCDFHCGYCQNWVTSQMLRDPDDLKRMADFLASVDPLMPWHMTAFHPDYKMTDGYRSTTVEDLMRVVDLGRQAGMKYMYPGNLPGQVGEWENTRCHHCDATVIRRHGFLVQENRLSLEGKCPDCGGQIPGVWGKSSGHRDGRVRVIV